MLLGPDHIHAPASTAVLSWYDYNVILVCLKRLEQKAGPIVTAIRMLSATQSPREQTRRWRRVTPSARFGLPSGANAGLSAIQSACSRIDNLPLLSTNHGRRTTYVLRDMPGACSSTRGRHTPILNKMTSPGCLPDDVSCQLINRFWFAKRTVAPVTI